MKIVLLVLGGNPEQASEYLQTSHPGAVIEKISRDQLTGSSPADRLRAVRALGPEIFAVATERLAWQQGQNALLLFGASARAGRVMLFDSHGASREETRGQVILRAPFRFLRDAWVNWQTLRRARRDLSRLERELASGNIGEFDLRAGVEAAPRITYLRTTPAAGTQSGGASTHTIGFIKGAIESGAQVLLISNDHLAGLDESRVSMTLIEPDPLGLTRAAFDLRNGMLFTDRSRLEIKKQSPDFIYQRYSRFNWSGV